MGLVVGGITAPRSGWAERTLLVRRRDDLEAEVRVLEILNRQDDLECRARMHREVAALETIDHPYIPKLVESNAGDFRDLSIPLYMIMDHVEGTTLEQVVERNGPLGLGDGVRMTVALLNAVAACHNAGLVHRDIKRDNIIVPQSGGAHLVDWGLSCSVDNPGTRETGEWRPLWSEWAGCAE